MSAAAHAQLVELGRSALRVLVDLVPRAVWRAVKRALAGFFLVGFAGLAFAGAAVAARALGLFTQPTWLVLVQLGWVPFVFAVAGGYVGAVDGFLTTLAEEVEQRGLAARIFAVVKPACVAVARKLRSAPGGSVTGELRRALDARLAESEVERPRSLGERVERFLAMRSRRMLCFAALRAVVTAKDNDGAARELEALGVDRLQHVLVETIEDLFTSQAFLAAAAALVAAAAPALLHAIMG